MSDNVQQTVSTDAQLLHTAARVVAQKLPTLDLYTWLGKRYFLHAVNVAGDEITIKISSVPAKNQVDNPVVNPRATQPVISLHENEVLTMDMHEEIIKHSYSLRSELIDSIPSLGEDVIYEPPTMLQNPDVTERATFGVEPIGDDKNNPVEYSPIALQTEQYDLSLKIPLILDHIRSGDSVIFEGTRFSGKRRCIISSIMNSITPYRPDKKPGILVITFERESTEYFYREVNKSITPGSRINTTLCVGSTKVRDNVRELEQGSQIVFGTPARLVDLMNRGVLKIEDVRFLVMYCNRHLPAEFQDPLQKITRELPKSFQYLITYPLGANFDFNLLQSYTYHSFCRHVPILDSIPHFHRLNIVSEPLYKRDVQWMMQNELRVGIICDRGDLRMIDMWLGDITAPIKCLIPTYRKLPSKGRERRQFIKASKALFKERCATFMWGILLILQESVKFAPNALDGSLDGIVLLGNSPPKIHDPDYRDHMLVKPGGHVFLNVPDLQFTSSNPPSEDTDSTGKEYHTCTTTSSSDTSHEI